MSHTITARIHPDSLKRVTRMYKAGLDDVLSELFQNARRAAALIRVRFDPEGPTLAVEDNGCGIADPQVLLSFGENGWDESLTRREDAAGTGFACLSRFHSRVTSKAAATDAFQVSLEPDHFLGVKPAVVTSPEHATGKTGTLVTIALNRDYADAESLLSLTQWAARYLNVPVVYESSGTDIPCPQEPFLKESLHTADWRGLRLAVYPRHARQACSANLNYFGHTLEAPLPHLTLLDDTVLDVAVDVEDCPELELVLPARKSVVQGDFLKALQERARKLLFETVPKTGYPHVAFKDFSEARSLGIDIQPPPPRLPPWTPSPADQTDFPRHPRNHPESLPEGAFIRRAVTYSKRLFATMAATKFILLAFTDASSDSATRQQLSREPSRCQPGVTTGPQKASNDLARRIFAPVQTPTGTVFVDCGRSARIWNPAFVESRGVLRPPPVPIACTFSLLFRSYKCGNRQPASPRDAVQH